VEEKEMDGEGQKRGEGRVRGGIASSLFNFSLRAWFGPKKPRNHMALGPDPPQDGAILWVSGPLKSIANL